jgi:hypothetical protein
MVKGGFKASKEVRQLARNGDSKSNNVETFLGYAEDLVGGVLENVFLFDVGFSDQGLLVGIRGEPWMNSEVVMVHEILEEARERLIGTVDRIGRHVLNFPEHRKSEGSILTVNTKRAGRLVGRGGRSGRFLIVFLRFFSA